MNKKRILKTVGILTIIVGVIVILLFGDYIAPRAGSGSFTEKYKFNIDEDKLINAIEKFKQDNPQFVVPKEILLQNRTTHGLRMDSGYDAIRNAYGFTLYFRQKAEAMTFWIMQQDINGCEVGLTVITKGPTFDTMKLLYRQLSIKESKEAKNFFEEQFLDKLSIKYEKEGNGLPIVYNWFH